jgi:hypothetical protein
MKGIFGGVLLLGIVVAAQSVAEDTKLSPAEQIKKEMKAQLVAGLIQLGQESQDPLVLMTAAKIPLAMQSGRGLSSGVEGTENGVIH